MVSAEGRWGADLRTMLQHTRVQENVMATGTGSHRSGGAGAGGRDGAATSAGGGVECDSVPEALERSCCNAERKSGTRRSEKPAMTDQTMSFGSPWKWFHNLPMAPVPVIVPSVVVSIVVPAACVTRPRVSIAFVAAPAVPGCPP